MLSPLAGRIAAGKLRCSEHGRGNGRAWHNVLCCPPALRSTCRCLCRPRRWGVLPVVVAAAAAVQEPGCLAHAFEVQQRGITVEQTLLGTGPGGSGALWCRRRSAVYRPCPSFLTQSDTGHSSVPAPRPAELLSVSTRDTLVVIDEPAAAPDQAAALLEAWQERHGDAAAAAGVLPGIQRAADPAIGRMAAVAQASS